MKINFVILSQSRSGSTLLQQLIDSHPQVICDEEIFNRDQGYVKNPFFLKLWKKIPYPLIYYHRYQNESSVYGFKLFTYHLDRTGRAVHILHKLGWKIIYLNREDVIEQVLSGMIATRTNQWRRDGQIDMTSARHHIPVDQFIESVKGRLMWQKVEANILKELPHLSLTYEGHLRHEADWQNSLNRVFDFLNIENCDVQTSIKKMYKQPYSEMVANFDELIEALETEKIR